MSLWVVIETTVLPPISLCAGKSVWNTLAVNRPVNSVVSLGFPDVILDGGIPSGVLKLLQVYFRLATKSNEDVP